MPKKQQSDPFFQRVRLYSFILTVLVIWIHAVRPDLAEEAAAAEAAAGTAAAGSILRILGIRIQTGLGRNLGQMAVPGFFVLSGYLFFHNMDPGYPGSRGTAAAGLKNNLDFFLGKWKSRLKTLLLPYLLWNLIYYCIYLIFGRASLSLGNLWKALLLYRYNPVFWYLQQLILITLLTPLLWMLLRHRRAVFPVLAALLFLAVFYRSLPFHLVNEDALFYYAAGSAGALHFRTSAEETPAAGSSAQKRAYIAGILCLLLFILLQPASSAAFMRGLTEAGLFCTILCRLSGALGLYFLLQAMGLPRGQLPFYMEETFFIYTAHYMELRAVQMAVRALGGGEAAELAAYLLMPAFCVLISAFCAELLRKYLPGLFSLLTGGRSPRSSGRWRRQEG